MTMKTKDAREAFYEEMRRKRQFELAQRCLFAVLFIASILTVCAILYLYIL